MNKYEIAIKDVIFNSLLGITVLVIITLLQINEPQKEEQELKKPNAEFIVNIEWPSDMDIDIDLYVRDPAGNICYFRSREVAFMNLNRDDTGIQSDSVLNLHGQAYQFQHNTENITIRGIIPGEYIINAHYYSSDDSKPIVPVPIRGNLIKINPTIQTIWEGLDTLHDEGDEITLIRFIVDENGQVIKTYRLDTNFVGVAP